MGHLIRPQDVEQFSEIIRVPDEAITTAVLESVKQLDERRELEPLIREILWDRTQTPHGPTEIADIFTTKVDVGGRRCVAAFVLKGKSFAKVRAADIDHQLIRIAALPVLDVMALVVVGDLQDDARRDLLQVATSTGSDFLLVEADDCARLLIAYGKICPRDGSPFDADGLCRQGHTRPPSAEVNLAVTGEPEYEIVSLEDVSHAGARRLSAKVAVNRSYSREAMRDVIRRATDEVAQDTYHRNGEVARRWGASQAHVVWLFLAGDALDIRNYNWLARTQWIDSGLADDMRPMALEASEYVRDIAVVWEVGYAERRKYYREHQAPKGEFLSGLDSLVRRARIAGVALCDSFDLFLSGSIEEPELTRRIRGATAESEALVRQSADLPFPSEDTKDYDSRAQGVFAWLHNMTLYYSDRGMEMWPERSRTCLMKDTVRDFRRELARVELERQRIP